MSHNIQKPQTSAAYISGIICFSFLSFVSHKAAQAFRLQIIDPRCECRERIKDLRTVSTPHDNQAVYEQELCSWILFASQVFER
jgi:hypothetical protein